MVDRYISVQDMENEFQLGVLSESTDPKLSVVEKWITLSENEIDDEVKFIFNEHTKSNELLEVDQRGNIFLLHDYPLLKVTSISLNSAGEWGTPVWASIGSEVSDFRILNKDIGQIKTKQTFNFDSMLRATYVAGYKTIPGKIIELCTKLFEKRKLLNDMGFGATDTEAVSIASIKIKDKMNSSLKYKTEILDKEISRLFAKAAVKKRPMNYFYVGNAINNQGNSRERQW